VEDRTPEDHLCGEYKCQSCGRYVLNDHQCYVRATPTEEEHIPKFIFFDLECTQDDVLQCEEGYLTHKIPSCQQCKEGSPCKSCTLCQNCTNSWCGKMEHRPNLLVAHTVCPKCIAKELTPKYKCKSCGTRCETCGDEEYEGPPCKDTCGFREVVFKGNDTPDQFGAWLFSDHHKYFTAVAHNMKGYDGVYILNYLIEQSIRSSKIIYNGSKIMYMHVERGLNIRIIESQFLSYEISGST